MFTNDFWRKQNLKKDQHDYAFIFNILSEKTLMVFVYIGLVLEIKNVVNLIKKRFYWKRAVQLCVTMWKLCSSAMAIIM